MGERSKYLWGRFVFRAMQQYEQCRASRVLLCNPTRCIAAPGLDFVMFPTPTARAPSTSCVFCFLFFFSASFRRATGMCSRLLAAITTFVVQACFNPCVASRFYSLCCFLDVDGWVSYYSRGEVFRIDWSVWARGRLNRKVTRSAFVSNFLL